MRTEGLGIRKKFLEVCIDLLQATLPPSQTRPTFDVVSHCFNLSREQNRLPRIGGRNYFSVSVGLTEPQRQIVIISRFNFRMLPEQLEKFPMPQPLNVSLALGDLLIHLPLGFFLGQPGIENRQSMLGIPKENAPEIVALFAHHSVPFIKSKQSAPTPRANNPIKSQAVSRILGHDSLFQRPFVTKETCSGLATNSTPFPLCRKCRRILG